LVASRAYELIFFFRLDVLFNSGFALAFFVKDDLALVSLVYDTTFELDISTLVIAIEISLSNLDKN
jgi:hypothetical protein